MIFNHPRVKAAPPIETFPSTELKLFVKPAVKDEGTGAVGEQTVAIEDKDPAFVDSLLRDELSLVKPSSAVWETVPSIPSTLLAPIANAEFFSSVSNCGAIRSPFSNQNHGPVPIHSLISCLPTSKPGRGLRHLGLISQPSTGPHFPRHTTAFLRDAKDDLRYTLSWLPAGAFLDVRALVQGTCKIVTMLLGHQLWITWPSTPKNRKLVQKIRHELVAEGAAIYLVAKVLDALEGLHVLCIGAGESFKLSSGMFYSVLSLESSASIQLDFANLDEWDEALSGMKWELGDGEANGQSWDSCRTRLATRTAYVMWRRVITHRKNRKDCVEKLEELDQLVKAADALKKKLS